MSSDVVLITGASRGIGRYLANYFLERGAIVEGCSRGPVDWEKAGYRHSIVDVMDEGQVRALFSDLRARHGRLDVVINNAGAIAMNSILLTPAESLDRIMDANFRGTFLVCRECVRLMMRGNFGRIVNFSSVALPMRLEGEAAYVAAKAAVVAFSQVLAREVASYGITVNVVAPSPVETDLIRDVPKEKIARLVESMPLKRMGTMDDVANVVEFFTSRRSGNITGQVICLGGVGW